MTHPRALSVGIAFILASALSSACRDETDGEIPPMLRVRLETEMKMILRDVSRAQATAAATEGRYVELEELLRRFLSRDIPRSYELSLRDVSTTGFTAAIVHGASGLSCRLEVGGGGSGIPSCD